eukprot:7413039-Pyramimonas_sp.AAC.1
MLKKIPLPNNPGLTVARESDEKKSEKNETRKIAARHARDLCGDDRNTEGGVRFGVQIRPEPWP